MNGTVQSADFDKGRRLGASASKFEGRGSGMSRDFRLPPIPQSEIKAFVEDEVFTSFLDARSPVRLLLTLFSQDHRISQAIYPPRKLFFDRLLLTGEDLEACFLHISSRSRVACSEITLPVQEFDLTASSVLSTSKIIASMLFSEVVDLALDLRI